MKDFLALITFISAIGFGVCLINESDMAQKFGGVLLISYISYLAVNAYENTNHGQK
jgi:hypothetical protein